MLFSPPINSSWVEILPDGHQGTWRTLDAMRYLVRKDVGSGFVTSCVSSILEMARQQGIYDPVAALFLYARDCIRFQEDPPGIEKISDFERTTQAGAGDCDDKSIWLATALLSLDVPVRFVVQSYGQQWDHVFIEFYSWAAWSWIALDPTADGHTGVIAGIGWRQPLNPVGYEMTYSI